MKFNVHVITKRRYDLNYVALVNLNCIKLSSVQNYSVGKIFKY